MNDPIPSAVQEVVDLFVSELASLKFGDLEPTSLAAACEEVKASAADVIRAEAALENTRAVLGEKRDALLQKAQRALAYARVYAENQPELASRLDHIALPRSPRRSAKSESSLPDAKLSGALEMTIAPVRRRGRPRSEPTAMLVDDIDRSATAATSDNLPA
ncbi:MAG TPA: hypothetical protein VK540_14145 [Polyangiaceae bacterium]|nr:hypothetical protein [Polyangiaceae bacterium]